jgi:chitinase
VRLRVEALECRTVPAVVVSYHLDQDWGSGYQATVRIDNTGPAAVSDWRVEFDLDDVVAQVWDARVVRRDGSHYTLAGAGWNDTLAAGGSVSFGFLAAPVGAADPPANFAVNGVPTDGTTPAPLPTLSAEDATVTEGNSGTTDAVFAVKLSAASATPVTVRYTTAPGTATAGSDFVPATGTLTFAPGETVQYVRVAVIGDSAPEPDETLSLVLSQPSGATLARGTAAGTIRDDDAPAAGAINFRVTDNWGSGFVGEVTVRNTGTTPLNEWTASFDFAGQIASLWNGTVVSHVGNHYVVRGAAWNSDLSVGEETTFGFTASPGGAGATVTNLTLDGTTPPPATPPAENPPPAAAGTWPGRVFAPYVDVTLYPLFDLAAAARDTGARYFNLAFVTADPSGAPAWGGYAEYAVGSGAFHDALVRQINAVRAVGGDVAASFGGASGTELAQAITDTGTLTAAYRKVVDAYGLRRIDFDIEGAAVADRASVERRWQAVARLQHDLAAAGTPLEVWVTLPVLPTGLTADGLAVVQSALRNGVTLAGVNVMAMDYGDSAAPSPAGRMGDYAIAAARSTHDQLATLSGASRTDAELWAMVGVTPMIGLNDVTTEIFDPTEARELLAFAEQYGLGMLSMWSLNRDRQNPGGAIGYVEATSSSLAQSAWEFTGILSPFTE